MLLYFILLNIKKYLINNVHIQKIIIWLYNKMQEFSEKRKSKLSIENIETFIPKKLKFSETELQIDTNLLESSEDNLGYSKYDDQKKYFNLQRRLSTESTTFSKNDELSEISSLPTPTNNESKNLKLFGQFKSYSSPVSNFFLGVDDYFKEILPEGLEYIKTGNYITKEKYLKENFSTNEKPVEKINDISENQKNISLIEENQTPLTISSINPIPIRSNRGKFDLPMYYIGFYNLNSKKIFFNIF